MTWWESALLGLIQGLTEFLPVSSSGHLVLGKHILGLSTANGDVLFEVLLHFGTVLSIVYVYRARLTGLIAGFLSTMIRPAEWAPAYRAEGSFRLGVHILITMVPTGLAYVLFSDFFETAFTHPRMAAAMLLVTGLLLVLTTLRRNPDGQITGPKAFLIGAAQSLAMIPGISRSGATICTALYQNVTPEKAADFSFLMLLPVVLGATVLKVSEALGQTADADWLILLLGTAVAFASGIVAIRIVLDFVRRGRLQYFAIYCFAAGAAGLILI